MSTKNLHGDDMTTPPRRGVFRVPDLRKTTRNDWTQLVRFCLVGASGFVVNLVVFSVAFTMLHMHHTVAAVLAFCVAWLNNFVLNRQWTFTSSTGSAWGQAVRYFASSVVALGLNVGILEAAGARGPGRDPGPGRRRGAGDARGVPARTPLGVPVTPGSR